MDWKPGKPRLRIPSRASVLGGGLLERVRSTTFALLGVTAAVGLAMVALALNQSWPLLAGSPIPAAPAGDEDVGAAKVVSRAAGHRRPGSDTAPGNGAKGSRADRTSGAARRGPGGGSPSDPAQRGSGEFVHASTPLKSGDRGATQKPAQGAPDRQSEPAKPQTQAATPQPSPSPQPAPPTAPPASETETSSPPATASSAPPEEESNVPSWSEGRGHAYGRGDRDREDRGHGDWDRDRSHGRRWDD